MLWAVCSQWPFSLFSHIWHFSSSPSLITTISYPARIELRGHGRARETGKFLLDWYYLGWSDILHSVLQKLPLSTCDGISCGMSDAFFSSWPMFFCPPSFFPSLLSYLSLSFLFPFFFFFFNLFSLLDHSTQIKV